MKISKRDALMWYSFFAQLDASGAVCSRRRVDVAFFGERSRLKRNSTRRNGSTFSQEAIASDVRNELERFRIVLGRFAANVDETF